MGLMDKLRNLLQQHPDKVDEGLEKAGDMANSRFPGHDEQIKTGVSEVERMVAAEDATPQHAPGEPPPGTPPQGPAPDDAVPADPAGGYERAQEVPGGPQPDVPAGPGHEPPPQR
ncbi:antitoxin [Pseudonocardia xinjiangensis]|uniref:antitoxin n=1 Tax=Pseudonocardia xinjiangensis TaxID=75289 RepID=UPI003D90F642